MATGSSLTYFSKKPIECPLCEEKIYREELRMGRGRQIAGNLTRELRRHYETSKQYGESFPLLYPVTVCPRCLYSAYPEDFDRPPEGTASVLRDETQKRLDYLGEVLPALDFTEPRGLPEGLASYVYATLCYEHFPASFSPTFKCGVSQLRAAWLASDLHRKRPSENFDYLARVFYRKARYYYSRSVECESDGTESMAGVKSMGPDLDKNYGYDGVLYINGLLEYDYGPRTDADMRAQALGRAKRSIARIFGMGRASKDKPAAILDNARDVYEAIAKELGDAKTRPDED